jgi:hypothetical protein
MTLVFALTTYLGIQLIDTSYFRSINDCFYFANKINKNPAKPNPENKSVKYTAICVPTKVNKNRTDIF